MFDTINIFFLQKLIAAFESLRLQAEADQQEMQKGLFSFKFCALLLNNFILVIYSELTYQQLT